MHIGLLFCSSDTDDEECGVATPKSGGRETVGDGSRSAACFAGGESEGGACASSPGDPAACAPSPAAQEPPPHRCWFCGSDHNEADCEWYRILFVDAVPIASNATALRPMGHLAAPSNAVTLERHLVQTKDVPSDGACLFHALGTELKCVFRSGLTSQLLPKGGARGSWTTCFSQMTAWAERLCRIGLVLPQGWRLAIRWLIWVGQPLGVASWKCP